MTFHKVIPQEGLFGEIFLEVVESILLSHAAIEWNGLMYRGRCGRSGRAKITKRGGAVAQVRCVCAGCCCWSHRSVLSIIGSRRCKIVSGRIICVRELLEHWCLRYKRDKARANL